MGARAVGPHAGDLRGGALTQLSPSRLGAQDLVGIARQKKSGRLTWTVQGKAYALELAQGRPVRAIGASGQANDDRAAVVRTLRAFALADNGVLELTEGAVSGESTVDTLGEVLVELGRGLTPAHVAAISGAYKEVSPSPEYDRLRDPIARVSGGPPGTTMTNDRATVIAFVLGALIAKPPALLLEIATAHAEMALQDHYEFLGVGRNAKADDIRKAYFDHAKRWHTDRFAGLDLGEHREQADALFRRADEAQKVLSDPQLRGDYDVTLDRLKQGLPTDVNVVLEAEGLFRKAQIFVRRGQAAAAEPLLAQAIAMNKGEAEFYAYHGYSIFAAKGESAAAEAIAQINKSLEMNPKLDSAYEYLGKIARVEGKLDLAVKHLKKALELNAKNREAERELRFVQNQLAKAPQGGGLLGKLLKR
ncbi:MAG: DnaJ domain-containing protein [Myxococcota bacterium]|nr:DnaJ domain-containing protein [Myxococcota bacterium]